MSGQLLIRFLILFEHFFLSPFHSAIDLQFLVSPLILSLHNKERFIMTDILGIRQIKIAFTHGKLIQGIQNIRFPYAVIPYKTIKTGTEYQCRFRYVFEVYYIQFFNNHPVFCFFGIYPFIVQNYFFLDKGQTVKGKEHRTGKTKRIQYQKKTPDISIFNLKR